MRVVLAGGGTAGHVIPALAVAASLADGEVRFIGTSRGAEASLVPAAGYPLDVIDVRGFDRARPWSFGRVGVRAGAAVAEARRALVSFQPDVLLGMGGYVSLPAVLAARTMKVPVVLHEQNIVLGLAHKVSRPFARRIAVSFAETLATTGRRGVFTGNPVRRELTHLDREAARQRGIDAFSLDPQRKTLLVFGGSLGAQRINDAAAGLAHAWRGRTDVQILHIAGRAAADALAQQVQGAGAGDLLYRVVPYVDDMAAAYCVADLALCRGGASTVAELTVMGLPSIIVPYPHHRDRQQERHAQVLQSRGAARVLLDADTSTEAVAALVDGVWNDEASLASMRAAALELARPDAAIRVRDVLVEAAR